MSDDGNIRCGRREQKEDSQTETEINSNAKKTRLEILRRKVSSSPRGISSQDETGEPVKYRDKAVDKNIKNLNAITLQERT